MRGGEAGGCRGGARRTERADDVEGEVLVLALAEEALEDAQEGEELPRLRDKHGALVRVGAGELREGGHVALAQPQRRREQGRQQRLEGVGQVALPWGGGGRMGERW